MLSMFAPSCYSKAKEVNRISKEKTSSSQLSQSSDLRKWSLAGLASGIAHGIGRWVCRAAEYMFEYFFGG